MFTKEQLAEILAVCEKATEGPWKVIDIPGDVTFVYTKRPISASDENICIDCSLSDANFIALARTVLPQLAEDYRKLLAVVEAAISTASIHESSSCPWVSIDVGCFEALQKALAAAGYGGEE